MRASFVVHPEEAFVHLVLILWGNVSLILVKVVRTSALPLQLTAWTLVYLYDKLLSPAKDCRVAAN